MTATVVETGSARAVLIERLQSALEALEQGDETRWRQHLDSIAAWRNQPMMQGLGRLARALAHSLGELPPSHSTGDLDDACARLDHVVTLTEQASHKTLDLAERCAQRVDQLKACTLDPQHILLIEHIRSDLSEMALAQSYQDLTGQIIRRVAGIVRQVHEGFRELGLPPPKKQHEGLAGPAVAGLDNDAFSQDDADDLLSGLGL